MYPPLFPQACFSAVAARENAKIEDSHSAVVQVFLKFINFEKATNFHRRFVLCSNGRIYDGDFAKFCDLLRIYEL